MLGRAVFCAGVAMGVARGCRTGRLSSVVAVVYVVSVVFFAPVWVFASPYAAVAGLTIAHGLQYLLLMWPGRLGQAASGRPRC